MMQFDFIFGGFIPNDSFFHQVDPRVKLIYTVIGMIVIFLIQQWLSFFVIGLTLLMMFFGSKISFSTTLKAYKSIWILFVLAFIFPLFNTTGKILINFGFIIITEDALISSLMVTSRLILLIGFSLLMTSTTSPLRLADSTESILKIVGLKKAFAHEIAMVMSLAIRFIPIISMEANHIIKAQKARGAKFNDRNIIKRAKAIFPIIIPLLVSSFKRADELALAMDVRYYQGFQGRTKYIELKMKASDVFLLVLILVVLVLALLLDKVINFV